jgi:hypothetical protein
MVAILGEEGGEVKGGGKGWVLELRWQSVAATPL